MRSIKLFQVLLLFVFAFASCDNDDIDINQLIGEWYVFDGDSNLSMDGSVNYTFNADKSCSKVVCDFLSEGNATFQYTYVISIGNDLISLRNDEDVYVEQYYILKLNSKEMVWRRTDPYYGGKNEFILRRSTK